MTNLIDVNPGLELKLENIKKPTKSKSPLNKAISLHGIFERKRDSAQVTFNDH